MYYNPFSPQCYYYVTVPMYNDGRSVYWTIPNEMEKVHRGADLRSSYEDRNLLLKDYGPKPFVVNINRPILRSSSETISRISSTLASMIFAASCCVNVCF